MNTIEWLSENEHVLEDILISVYEDYKLKILSTESVYKDSLNSSFNDQIIQLLCDKYCKDTNNSREEFYLHLDYGYVIMKCVNKVNSGLLERFEK